MPNHVNHARVQSRDTRNSSLLGRVMAWPVGIRVSVFGTDTSDFRVDYKLRED